MTRTWLAVSIFTLLTLSGWARAQTSPRPSDPANAAYWYQKAFDLYGDPNDIDLKAYARGKTPLTSEIEQVILKQKPVLDCLAKAARSDYCDWDFDPFDNINDPIPYFESVLKIFHLLCADIRYAKSRTTQTFPLQSIESVLLLAKHIDSEYSMNYLLSLVIRSRIYPIIIDVLKENPNVPRTDLISLHTIIAYASKSQCSLKDTLEYEMKEAKIALGNPEKHFGPSSPLLSYYGLMVDRSDEFIKRNYTFFNKYIMSIQKSLDLPYPEAYQELKRIEDTSSEKLNELRERLPKLPRDGQLSEVDKSYIDTCDFLYTALLRPGCLYPYNTEIRTITQQNALIAALDILVEYQKSNTLPDAMPKDSPKDLFSDKSFLLIKTDEGFTLKCQGQDLSRNEIHEYSFKLQKR